MIDGASRLKRIRHIDLPAIMPTICTLLILRFGSIVGVGFEKAYMLQSPLNQEVSEVISTYVFKYGMDSFRSFSYGTAVSLFNTAINMTLMFIVNKISKKISDDEISLF
jgi:putative aldouronate transport system permease protein